MTGSAPPSRPTSGRASFSWRDGRTVTLTRSTPVSSRSWRFAAPVRIGDTIHVVGHTTDFTETIESMQIDHDPVKKGKKGEDVGIHVVGRARIHDQVYKVG